MKKKQRMNGLDSGGMETARRSAPGIRDLSGFMAQTANSVLNTPWQILQVNFQSLIGTPYHDRLLHL